MSEGELLQRIERLEARGRRARWGLAALGVTALCTLALGWTQATRDSADRTVKATRFVLVDNEGRERAVLGFADNRVGLFVFGDVAANAREPLFVGLDAGTPRLSLQGDDYRTGVSPGILLCSTTSGKGLVVLSSFAGLQMDAQRGRLRVAAGAQAEWPGLRLEDENGDTRFIAQLVDDGDPTVQLYRKIESNASKKWRDAMAEIAERAAAGDVPPELLERHRDAEKDYTQARAESVAVVIGAASRTGQRTGITIGRPVNSLGVYGPGGVLLWEVP